MKRRILSLLLAVCLIAAMLPSSVLAARYADTSGHWAQSSIERWSDAGVVQGSGGAFAPDSDLTCAQLATILAKLLRLPAADDAGFSDNLADAWYYDAINRCAAAGILTGYADGTVRPNESMSRARAMVMLARALGIEAAGTSVLNGYADAASVPEWARGYVAALIRAGIVSGVSGSRLAALADITRAQFVTILDRAIAVYADEDGEKIDAEDADGIIVVVAEDVTIQNAPAGTSVIAGADAQALRVNGKRVDAGTTYIVPETVERPKSVGHAHVHDYEYTDNGDGTHTGRCAGCGSTLTPETHTFEAGICTLCGAGSGESKETPILIRNERDLSRIKNTEEYTYYKVADGVTEINCAAVSKLELYGEFDGNGVILTNLCDSLFQTVGNGKETEKTTVLKNFTAMMNGSGNSLVFSIAGLNTKFEDVTVSGYMEGNWNMGAFVNYGSANSDGNGFDYTVKFESCACNALIVSKGSSSAAVLVGHTYPGTGRTATIKLDSATNEGIEKATMRIKPDQNDNDKVSGCKYFGVGSAQVYVDDTTQSGRGDLPEDNVKKLRVLAPEKGDDGSYAVKIEDGTTQIRAQLTAQLTAYDEEETEIENLKGITFTLGGSWEVDFTEGDQSADVFDKIESVKIRNEKTDSDRPAYTFDEDTKALTVYTNATNNYVTGTVRIAVSQYDENGLIAAGSLVVAKNNSIDETWTVES